MSVALVALAFVVTGVAVPVLVCLLTDDARGWLPHLARAVVRSAGRGLSPDDAERYTEEWLAEVDAYADRPLTALARAIGVRWSTRSMRRALMGRPARVPLWHRALAVVALVVVAPTFAMLALAVRVSSRGPVLRHTEIVWPDGRRYTRLTFRTTAPDAPDASGAQQLTTVGRFLDTYAFEQFPRLVNVVLGDIPFLPPGYRWRDMLLPWRWWPPRSARAHRSDLSDRP